MFIRWENTKGIWLQVLKKVKYPRWRNNFMGLWSQELERGIPHTKFNFASIVGVKKMKPTSGCNW